MSSRSQSSSRRSSRRRSGRSSQSKEKTIVKKTVAQHGANFWVMLAGFVTSMTLLLLVVSLFTTEEISSNLLATTDENRAEVATQAKSKDFESFVENAKADQLLKTLTSLEDVDSYATEKKYLTNLQRREVIINTLIEKPLSEDDRRRVVMAQLKTTSILFWNDRKKTVNEAELGTRLREVAEAHVEDTAPEIAFESRVQLARLNSQTAAQQPVAFAKELHGLLADFPTNERVQTTLTDSLDFLVSTPEYRPATIRILDQFFKMPKVAGNQETATLYSLLQDLDTLCELDFFESYDNVKFTGSAGRDKLRAVCLDLAKIPTAGKEVVGNIGKAANWMETNGYYKYAIEIYMALRKSAARLTNRGQVNSSNLKADWGIKRCEAVGKTFNLATNLYDGKPMRLAPFESMPVLIVFYSKAKTESILLRVEEASLRWRQEAVKVIVVQVENDSENFDQNRTRELAEKFSTWSFCYDDGRGTGPIFSQIPGRNNERIALLDKQHILYDVDVDLEELVTSVTSVLATRTEKNKR